MEERYGYFSQGSGRWRAIRDGDFQEEDVWAVLKDEEGSSTSSKIGKKSKYFSNSASRHLPTAARMIPRTSKPSSGYEAKVVQQSAPVNIPDWSKIYGKKYSKKASKNAYDDDDDDGDDGDDGDDDGDGGDSDDEGGDDDYYDDDRKLPPHELIARRLARSQISFSVCEGIGRTLKGRDLSKVRNAVLTKTGFLE